MATSPNYGWAEPDNSSLVKNGASDIRTLGDAIDTSVWNVGFGQAGKNKIINGNFGINQRNFTSNTTSQSFNFDRWIQANIGGTATVTPQTFTLGSAPVAGYEGTNFLQVVTASQSASADYSFIGQKIESVRTLANQTVTVSFWAKATSGTPKVSLEVTQFFGTGGSPSSNINIDGGQVTLSTSWTRYSLTLSVPSISGKTLGTAGDDNLYVKLWVSAGSDYAARTGSIGIQNNTFQIWGVQTEAGSTATPFQTASGGSIQGELAMCQRYYYRNNALTSTGDLAQGQCTSTSNVNAVMNIPTQMRVAAISIDYPAMANFVISDGTSIASPNSITLNQATNGNVSLNVAYGSFTVGRIGRLYANGTTSAYIGVNAEL